LPSISTPFFGKSSSLLIFFLSSSSVFSSGLAPLIVSFNFPEVSKRRVFGSSRGICIFFMNIASTLLTNFSLTAG